jgi:hypothetical protein
VVRSQAACVACMNSKAAPGSYGSLLVHTTLPSTHIQQQRTHANFACLSTADLFRNLVARCFAHTQL